MVVSTYWPVFPIDNTGYANMNLLRQSFRKLSSDSRQTDKQTDRHDRNYIPRRFACRWSKIASTICNTIHNLSDKMHTLSIVALTKHYWKRLWSCADCNSTWNTYLQSSIIAMLELLTLDTTYCTFKTWHCIVCYRYGELKINILLFLAMHTPPIHM